MARKGAAAACVPFDAACGVAQDRLRLVASLRLKVYLADPHDVPSWVLRLPKGATYDVTPQASAATKREGWRRGHCVLHLRGGETGPKAVKRSSPALRFALHMMAIVAVGRVDIP